MAVYAVGEEGFIYVNGNGLYGVGEPFEDCSEAWIDKNENLQCSREVIPVRDDLVIMLSGEQQLAVLDKATNAPIPEITLPAGRFKLSLRAIASDVFNNLSSVGATLSITANGCEIFRGGRYGSQQ
jgi:hypothetical protein